MRPHVLRTGRSGRSADTLRPDRGGHHRARDDGALRVHQRMGQGRSSCRRTLHLALLLFPAVPRSSAWSRLRPGGHDCARGHAGRHPRGGCLGVGAPRLCLRPRCTSNCRSRAGARDCDTAMARRLLELLARPPAVRPSRLGRRHRIDGGHGFLPRARGPQAVGRVPTKISRSPARCSRPLPPRT